MHSWPITVFAPISTTPSWQRILVPSPIQTKRPNSIRPAAGDLEFEAAAEEEQAVGAPAPAGDGEEAPPQVAQQQPPVAGVEHPVAGAEAERADHGGAGL